MVVGPERVLGGGALGGQRGAVGVRVLLADRQVPPGVGEAVPSLPQRGDRAVRLGGVRVLVVAEEHEHRPALAEGVVVAADERRGQVGHETGANRIARRFAPRLAFARAWPRSGNSTSSPASPPARRASSGRSSCAGSWPSSRVRWAPRSRSSAELLPGHRARTVASTGPLPSDYVFELAGTPCEDAYCTSLLLVSERRPRALSRGRVPGRSRVRRLPGGRAARRGAASRSATSA